MRGEGAARVLLGVVREVSVEAHARRESKGQVGSDADEEGGHRRGARRHDDQVAPELLSALDLWVVQDRPGSATLARGDVAAVP